jgi:hypothetical protein
MVVVDLLLCIMTMPPQLPIHIVEVDFLVDVVVALEMKVVDQVEQQHKHL